MNPQAKPSDLGTVNIKMPLSTLRQLPLGHLQALDVLHDHAAAVQQANAQPPAQARAPLGQAAAPAPAAPPSTLHRVLGGIGRVAKDVGVAAGSFALPEVMPFIPGTPQHTMLQQMFPQKVARVKGQAEQAAGVGAEAQATAGLTAQKTAAGYGTAQTRLMTAQASEEGARATYQGMYNKLFEQSTAGAAQGANYTLPPAPVSPNGQVEINPEYIASLAAAVGHIGELYGLHIPAAIGAYPAAKAVLDSALTLQREQNLLKAPSIPGGMLPFSPPIGGTAEEWSNWYREKYIPAQASLAGAQATATGIAKAATTPIPVVNPDTNRVEGVATSAGGEKLLSGNTPVSMAGGLQPKPTSAMVGKAQQASALMSIIPGKIIPLLDKMNAEGALGPIKGRFADFMVRKIGSGPHSADIANFQQLANGAISMLMGMYGFRRQVAVETMARMVGPRMTYATLRGAFEGILSHAEAIAHQGGMVAPAQAPAGKALGTTSKPDGTYQMNGKKYTVRGGKVYAAGP